MNPNDYPTDEELAGRDFDNSNDSYYNLPSDKGFFPNDLEDSQSNQVVQQIDEAYDNWINPKSGPATPVVQTESQFDPNDNPFSNEQVQNNAAPARKNNYGDKKEYQKNNQKKQDPKPKETDRSNLVEQESEPERIPFRSHSTGSNKESTKGFLQRKQEEMTPEEYRAFITPDTNFVHSVKGIMDRIKPVGLELLHKRDQKVYQRFIDDVKNCSEDQIIKSYPDFLAGFDKFVELGNEINSSALDKPEAFKEIAQKIELEKEKQPEDKVEAENTKSDYPEPETNKHEAVKRTQARQPINTMEYLFLMIRNSVVNRQIAAHHKALTPDESESLAQDQAKDLAGIRDNPDIRPEFKETAYQDMREDLDKLFGRDKMMEITLEDCKKDFSSGMSDEQKHRVARLADHKIIGIMDECSQGEDQEKRAKLLKEHLEIGTKYKLSPELESMPIDIQSDMLEKKIYSDAQVAIINQDAGLEVSNSLVSTYGDMSQEMNADQQKERLYVEALNRVAENSVKFADKKKTLEIDPNLFAADMNTVANGFSDFTKNLENAQKANPIDSEAYNLAKDKKNKHDKIFESLEANTFKIPEGLPSAGVNIMEALQSLTNKGGEPQNAPSAGANMSM